MLCQEAPHIGHELLPRRLVRAIVRPAAAAGLAAIADARSALDGYGADGKFPTITVQNNLPYIDRLENGYSKQAPAGMVSVTLAGLQARYGG